MAGRNRTGLKKMGVMQNTGYLVLGLQTPNVAILVDIPW